MALLELKSIIKEFPGVRALDGVSFDLQKGEVHALCGENGAGKSTLIKILCGYYPTGTYHGEILLDGRARPLQEPARGARSTASRSSPRSWRWCPSCPSPRTWCWAASRSALGLIRWDQVRAEAERALALVGLDVDPDRKVKELGIGQQQMVEIAKALAKNAEILVLDEPTAALTEADAQRLLRFLAELRTKGVSSIYISHRLEEVFQIADRITVLRDGRSVGTAPTPQLTTDRVIALMVGREVKNLYPRPPHREGSVAAEGRALVGGGPAEPRPPACCATSRSTCGRARCWASRASWARGAPRSSARSSARRAAA